MLLDPDDSRPSKSFISRSTVDGGKETFLEIRSAFVVLSSVRLGGLVVWEGPDSMTIRVISLPDANC